MKDERKKITLRMKKSKSELIVNEYDSSFEPLFQIFLLFLLDYRWVEVANKKNATNGNVDAKEACHLVGSICFILFIVVYCI